jgi:hypothetical protein
MRKTANLGVPHLDYRVGGGEEDRVVGRPSEARNGFGVFPEDHFEFESVLFVFFISFHRRLARNKEGGRTLTLHNITVLSFPAVANHSPS